MAVVLPVTTMNLGVFKESWPLHSHMGILYLSNQIKQKHSDVQEKDKRKIQAQAGNWIQVVIFFWIEFEKFV